MRVNTTLLSTEVQSQVQRVLSELRATAPQIRLTAWISLDGFVLVSATDMPMQPERIGAMSASLLALSRCAIQEVAAGQLRQVLVGGNTGMLLLTDAGVERALVLAADSGANVNRVLLDAQKTAMQLALISEVMTWQAP